MKMNQMLGWLEHWYHCRMWQERRLSHSSLLVNTEFYTERKIFRLNTVSNKNMHWIPKSGKKNPTHSSGELVWWKLKERQERKEAEHLRSHRGLLQLITQEMKRWWNQEMFET